MDYIQNLLTVVWALRWVITVAAFIALTALLVGARRERDDARVEARRLYFENADLRVRLNAHRRRAGAARAARRVATR